MLEEQMVRCPVNAVFLLTVPVVIIWVGCYHSSVVEIGGKNPRLGEDQAHHCLKKTSFAIVFSQLFYYTCVSGCLFKNRFSIVLLIFLHVGKSLLRSRSPSLNRPVLKSAPVQSNC